MDMEKLSKAISFATAEHNGQYRKDFGVPYIVHPIEVMKRVLSYGVKDEDVLCAAVLHDVIEDCGVLKDYLKESFGEKVSTIVAECSKGKDEDKDSYMESFKSKSVESFIIKIADRFCNVHDFILSGNVEYASKYAKKASCIFDLYKRISDSDIKLKVYNDIQKLTLMFRS